MNGSSYQKVQSESTLDYIRRRVDSVEETASGYQGCCPAHDDSNPSLSFKEEDGKVLLNCHAGCPTEEVVDALGLEMRDLFPDNADTSWKPWEEGVEVEAYTYRYAEGGPTFQVVRYEMRDPAHPAYGEKKFRQRVRKPEHPDAGKRGCPDDFVWGREDIDPFLYRRPKVVSG